MGIGHRSGAVALPKLSDDGGATLRAGIARVDGIHFAARLGVRLDRHSRIPAPVERRQPGQSNARSADLPADGSLRRECSQPDWCWFEEELSYDNAKLAHALILSGHATGQQAVFERGLDALRWLTKCRCRRKATSGRLAATGSIAAAARAPISTSSRLRRKPWYRLVWKLIARHRTSGGIEQAQRAFDWFIGWNDLGLELYSPETGGCRDGLHVDRVNGNQGAESTLAFLLSLAEMRLAQNMLTSFKEPIAIGALMSDLPFSTNAATILRPDPVARASAAVHSGRFRANRAGSSHGSCRCRKSESRPLLDGDLRRVLTAAPGYPRHFSGTLRTGLRDVADR